MAGSSRELAETSFAKEKKRTHMHVAPLRPTYGWFCWVFVLFLPRLPTTCSPSRSLSLFFRQLCTHLNREILFHAKSKKKNKSRQAKL